MLFDAPLEKLCTNVLVDSNSASTEGPPASPALANPLRVLVVDDSAMCRAIAASFILSAGHAVSCVEDGADAVEAVATMDFDVVMMDIRMPVVDGLEATGFIRALEGARGRVPIVAVTSQSSPDKVAFYLWKGMDGYLAKPFTPDSLLRALMQGAAEGQLN